MSESTKMHALQKARSIKKYVGYPDELLDDEKIEKFYSKVNEFFGKLYFAKDYIFYSI